MRHLSFNGELYPVEAFHLSVQNRAFRYGDGLFETMRSRSTQILFWEFHASRLLYAIKTFKYAVSVSFIEDVNRWIERLIKADKLFNTNSVRLQIYRKEGGKYAPDTNKVDVLIEVEPMDEKQYILNNSGLVIDTYEAHFKSSSRLGNFKNSSSILLVLAGVFKKENALDDVLILNERNHIVEALSSNIFLYIDGMLLTPALNTGCVDGVMRRVILQIAQANGIEVVESEDLVPEMILKADEVFLSNSIRGVAWVVAYKNKRFLYKMSRFFNQEINKLADQI